jgi:hypothetical protein
LPTQKKLKKLPSQMKTTEAVRKYAAEEGIAEEEVLVMEAKSKGFVEKGAEIYSTTEVGYTPF